MSQTLDPSSTRPVAVDMISPTRWIERGWEDLRANPWPGLAHGAVLTLFGWLMLWLARDRFWLLAPRGSITSAVSGPPGALRVWAT